MDVFGFFPITEDGTQDGARIACELAHEFSRTASDFGGGVKSITVTLILTNPQDLGTNHKDKRPVFHPGIRRIEALGTVVKLEDELEFSIRPDFAAVNGVNNKTDIANAIASALMEVHSQLARTDIPSFDMKCFLSEIGLFFSSEGRVCGD